MHQVTLIIPIYNGAQYLQKTLLALRPLVEKNVVQTIMIVNDGSTDTTSALLEEEKRQQHLPLLIVQGEQNRGKGFSLKRAVSMLPEGTTHVALTDGELPYGTDAIEKGLSYLYQHPEIAIVTGDRTQAPAGTRQYFWFRKWCAALFRLFVPRAVRHIHDTQSGLKFFTKESAQVIFPLITTDRWVWDIECFLIATQHAFPIYQMPVEVAREHSQTRGGVSLLAGAHVGLDMYHIHRNDKKHRYES